jgi:ribosomal protein L28
MKVEKTKSQKETRRRFTCEVHNNTYSQSQRSSLFLAPETPVSL